MEIKGAIFDVDGTLTESMGIWDTMGSDYLKSRGIEPPEDIDMLFRTMTVPEVAEHMHAALGLPESADELAAGINGRVEDFYYNRIEPKPGALELLRSLRKRGVRMCVATANEHCLIDAALERCGMAEYFDFVLTCTEAGTDKTKPDFFLIAAERLGTPIAETWVFEDMLHAVLSARAGGLRTVGVYDVVSVKYGGSLESAADMYVPSLTELVV